MDEACEEVHNDIKMVYRSKFIRAKVSQGDTFCMPDVIYDLLAKSNHLYSLLCIHTSLQMLECCNRLGVPMNCIFPVKNYHEEIQLNNDMDVLILSALTTILNFANDYVAEQPGTEEN